MSGDYASGGVESVAPRPFSRAAETPPPYPPLFVVVPGNSRCALPASSLPAAALYPAFDLLVGALGKAIGLAPVTWVAQAVAFFAFVVVFVKAGARAIGEHPIAPVLLVGALILVLQVTGERLVLAGMSILWAAIWWWLADGLLIETIWWPLEQVSNRLPDFRVSEDTSIVNLLMKPPMVLLVGGAIRAAGRSEVDYRFLMLAGLFLLSNQARYGGIVVPLIALPALSGFRTLHLGWPRLLRSAAVALATVSAAMLAIGTPSCLGLPRFELPARSVVLTGFNSATCSTLFANPGRVRVASAFEVGALDPGIQRLVSLIVRGRIDCDALAGLGFAHLIENSLPGPPSACRISATQLRVFFAPAS